MQKLSLDEQPVPRTTVANEHETAHLPLEQAGPLKGAADAPSCGTRRETAAKSTTGATASVLTRSLKAKLSAWLRSRCQCDGPWRIPSPEPEG